MSNTGQGGEGGPMKQRPARAGDPREIKEVQLMGSQQRDGLTSRLQGAQTAKDMIGIWDELGDSASIDDSVRKSFVHRIIELSRRGGDKTHVFDVSHYCTKIKAMARHGRQFEIPECIANMPLPTIVESVERDPRNPIIKPDASKGQRYVLNPGAEGITVGKTQYDCLFPRIYLVGEGMERSVTGFTVLDMEGNVVRNIDCAFDPTVHLEREFPDPELFAAEDAR